MTFNLENFVRPNILELKPYTNLRNTLSDENLVLLDANESPFGTFNRYPDSEHIQLRQKLADINSVNFDQLFLGNGSDELIDLLIRAFCEPAKDSILIMDPSFVMYQFYAKVNNVGVEKLKLDSDFNIVRDQFDDLNEKTSAKLLFLCSPNNPTGNSIEDLEYFIQKFKGIIVMDEAYIEFSTQKSATQFLSKYPNLIILKTLSKAYGMAGLRIGVGISSPQISAFMNGLKPPYNISSESQKIALEALANEDHFKSNLELILKERDQMKANLMEFGFAKKIYNSDANFLLVEMNNAEKIYNYLIENKILTSLRHPSLNNCLRIGIGLSAENSRLIEVLKTYN